jgi:hypothetical protein
METFTDIMALWANHQELAEDVGVSRGLIAVWKSRGSIPAAKWSAMARGAVRRGIPAITCERLAAIAESMAMANDTTNGDGDRSSPGEGQTP